MKAGAFKRITVAVDGSPASEAGVRCVLSLAAISSRSRRLDRPTNVRSDRGHLSVIRRNAKAWFFRHTRLPSAVQVFIRFRSP